MVCNCVALCGSWCFFFFQAEDGIRDLVRSRGLGDVYKRQGYNQDEHLIQHALAVESVMRFIARARGEPEDTWLSLIHI